MTFKFQTSPRVFGMAVIVVLLTCASGCRLMRSSFGPPGNKVNQRDRAVLHDPFPNNDVAPPILGGRPLGFDRPLPEARNNQYYQSRDTNRSTGFNF